MPEMFFERPTQVMFPDFDNFDELNWLCGIAYKDVIICSCCGGVFEIADVMDCAKECGFKQAIYPFGSWVNLYEEISGNTLPEGLTVNENYDIVEVDE